MTQRPPARPIHRLLVANRGEIAARVLATARELDIVAIAVYTPGDATHAVHASQAIELPSPASYLDIDHLVHLAREAQVDAVHPGYGFLSESAEFARRMWQEAQVVVVGPGWAVLERTGDKLMARRLAEECGVPVCPALSTSTSSLAEVQAFASKTGFPVMIKAVDGGGGRGIRLVRRLRDLEHLLRRAVQESPSRQVFCEKAAIDGFRHVEVQIVGDGSGGAAHLWERECSIQRKYQKIVELAPSTISDRALVDTVIECAVRMAEKTHYFSLGTFEFLVNPDTQEFFFLEINPRLQVEHTITESICAVDIVAIQLRISQGASLAQVGLSPHAQANKAAVPSLHSIQFRLTAEKIELPAITDHDINGNGNGSGRKAHDENKDEETTTNWTLSIGRIQSARFPQGSGIRVDTHIVSGHDTLVTSDFDSVVAKIIVTAASWEDVVRKARRALRETHITGVKTNLDVLRAIAASEDFSLGRCDTTWLEVNQGRLVEEGRQLTRAMAEKQAAMSRRTGTGVGGNDGGSGQASGTTTTTNIINTTLLFRKGDAWSITLLPRNDEEQDANDKANTVTNAPQVSAAPTHHLELSRVLRNEFPASISADVVLSDAAGGSSRAYTMHVSSTTSSSTALLAQNHRRGNPSDPAHVVAPFSGKLVEVLVDEGDVVSKGDVVCVIRQMKMELEVRSARAGTVTWVCEAEDEEEIGEGLLVCELALDGDNDTTGKPKL
ncbi:uncharacterized protein B0I36DRAFT_382171 [Microdochium trichocladiopsis]|uniref:Carbamoyl-phosphate synthase L chain, ATP binding domain-domain-containing protein n=1 Tax=Microdochium trichocladiopsis TaxID=1682393 RepID=A0A9P9BT21_9PEZI|nr:uncharacterized protein B0I36DRAFT_382171 [Microdochium trichocladiopsis]KAH7035475.1 hypothetical protein B0I36DRAFT_382171 [Microdochium trichocladiopsis]